MLPLKTSCILLVFCIILTLCVCVGIDLVVSLSLSFVRSSRLGLSFSRTGGGTVARRKDFLLNDDESHKLGSLSYRKQ
jgi:hypothetical protein